jgi:hypothetical protein
MMLTRQQAEEFTSKWLPSWTGNNPEKLASFYSDDVLYKDPAIPEGAHGKEELIAFFRKSLGQNPNWIWELIEPIPMEDGFLNKWRAKIPVGPKMVECTGVCLVQFNKEGLIKRNETYFDRTDLIVEIKKYIELRKTEQ